MIKREPPTTPADDQLLEFEDWIFLRVNAPVGENNRISARARLLLQMILENGEVSTVELQANGLNHPPSARRDARNCNWPVKTKNLTIDGKTQGVYYITKEMTEDRPVGALRKNFSGKFRRELLDHYGNKCRICGKVGVEEKSRKLQPDHRVPFDIAGDSGKMTLEQFMPLCGSCNRAKSWACEHCPNWEDDKRDPAVCATCYWCIPDGRYVHVATRPERRLEMTFNVQQHIDLFDALLDEADRTGRTISEVAVERLAATAKP